MATTYQEGYTFMSFWQPWIKPLMHGTLLPMNLPITKYVAKQDDVDLYQSVIIRGSLTIKVCFTHTSKWKHLRMAHPRHVSIALRLPCNWGKELPRCQNSRKICYFNSGGKITIIIDVCQYFLTIAKFACSYSTFVYVYYVL